MKYLKTIGFNSNQAIGRGFNYPYDIAFSADGRIFVLTRMGTASPSGLRIQICTFDDDWLGEFKAGPGDGNGPFKVPVCMDFDSDDNLHVTDESLNVVKVFDNQGNFVREWGGNGDGALAGPGGHSARRRRRGICRRAVRQPRSQDDLGRRLYPLMG